MKRALALLGVVVGAACQPASPPTRDSQVPPELADAEALAVLGDWSALPVFTSGRYRQQASTDRGGGGPPAQRIWQNENRDLNNFVCAGSGTEIPASPAPFVFELEACPEPWVRGVVLSRFEGSGRLARLWLTADSIRTAPADDEVLRIYVDDRQTPLVEAPLAAVLDGSAGEMFAPPFGAGSTRRLAWYYPVAFGSRLVVALDGLGARDLYFHQTDVVLDAAPRPRHAHFAPLPGRGIARELLLAAVPAAGTPRRARVVLAPGERVVTHELSGPATVVKARVRSPRSTLAALADVALEVKWDGVTAIALPLADLFAAGAAPPEPSSPALGARDDGDAVELSLRLPMPFASSARWSLTNGGALPVELEVVLEVADGVPTGSWGRLQVQRNETLPPAKAAHRLASAEGRGRLVGVCVTMRGHGLTEGKRPGHPMHFLEGDELGLVDGERAIAGTGTEDYFDGAFYFQDGPSGTAFSQVWGIETLRAESPPQARINACRWNVLGDTVDFASSLELELEIGPGSPDLLDQYRSIAFLYR
jgi:DUF2961 family protein